MKHVISISKMPAKAVSNEVCADTGSPCPGGGLGILTPLLGLFALLFKGGSSTCKDGGGSKDICPPID